MADASVANQQLLSAHGQNPIKMLRPVLHGHCLLPLRLSFRKIQISGHKLPHSTKLFLIQIVLGNYRLFQRGLIARKGGHAHKFFLRIGACVNDLRRGLPMNGIMNLILDFLEKLNGDFRLGIIVNTGRVDFKHLTVKHLFRSTDIADTLQQLLEVSAATQIFQALIIQSKTLTHILLQNFRCPNTKLHAALRLHTVTDRNDDIEIIVIHLIGFAVSGSCCKICNNCFSLQFALSENVLDMSGNGRFVSLKQLRHLVNGQPNGISIEGRFDLCQAILCGINHHFRIVLLILPAFHGHFTSFSAIAGAKAPAMAVWTLIS